MPTSPVPRPPSSPHTVPLPPSPPLHPSTPPTSSANSMRLRTPRFGPGALPHTKNTLSEKWLRKTEHTTILRSTHEYESCRDKAKNAYEMQIKRDIGRTFPLNDYFRKGRGKEQLESVLKAFANYNPKVGYVQGMNFLVGYLLTTLHNEEDAFWVFVGIMQGPKYDLAGLFTAEFPKMFCGAYQLDRMMRNKTPRLRAHLAGLEIESSLYLTKWLLTMYSSLLSPEAIKQTWDQFIDGGWTQLVRMTFAILQSAEPEILRITDFGNCVKYLTVGMWKEDHLETVLLARSARYIRECNDQVFVQLEIEYLMKAQSEGRSNVLEKRNMLNKKIQTASYSRKNRTNKAVKESEGWDSWEVVGAVGLAGIAAVGVATAAALVSHRQKRR